MYKSTVTLNLASGVTVKFHVTPNFQNRYLNRSKNVKTCHFNVIHPHTHPHTHKRHFNFFTKLILLMVIHPHTHPAEKHG